MCVHVLRIVNAILLLDNLVIMVCQAVKQVKYKTGNIVLYM